MKNIPFIYMFHNILLYLNLTVTLLPMFVPGADYSDVNWIGVISFLTILNIFHVYYHYTRSKFLKEKEVFFYSIIKEYIEEERTVHEKVGIIPKIIFIGPWFLPRLLFKKRINQVCDIRILKTPRSTDSWNIDTMRKIIDLHEKAAEEGLITDCYKHIAGRKSEIYKFYIKYQKKDLLIYCE